MTAPAIGPPQARRIDRLSRAAHAFHRFAHHPLCAAYAAEVFRVGRVRICKGCALALAGGLLGLLLGCSLQPPGLPVLLGLAGACGLAGLPGMVRPQPRLGKSLQRFLPAALAAFLIVQGFRPPVPPRLALAGLALAGLIVGILGYRRRGPDRSACESCIELASRPGCSGFAPIRRRERAFQRLVARWIEQA